MASAERFADALAYARKHHGQALLVQRTGDVVLEAYDGWETEKAHALYSGTKSFWGPVALVAAEEGLLELDESVGATFPEWADGARARVTLRMLLQLTSGIGFGGLGASVPVYAKALQTPLKNPPGAVFTYGGIPLQIFGAVLAERLRARDLTPHAYLRERVLEPAGVEIASWRTLADGTHPLPTGAALTARAWARYGAWVLAQGARFAECFVPSDVNARYGLGWWLHDGVRYASGSGGQALYLIPQADTVIARFGGGGSFNHDVFLRRVREALR